MRTSSRHLLAAASTALLIASVAGPAAAIEPTPAAVANDAAWAEAGIAVVRGLRSDQSTRLAPTAFPGAAGTVAWVESPYNEWPGWISSNVTLQITSPDTAVGMGDDSPVWSPGGTQLLFTRDMTASTTDGAMDIWVTDADGSPQKRLTANAANDIWATWSPDGHRVLFASNRSGNYEIYTMARDGTDVRRLTTHAATDSQPVWSPNGTTIAFVSDRAGTPDIWLMDADGTDPRRITTATTLELYPTWSPSGTAIAYSAGANLQYDVVKADLSGPTPVITNLTQGFGWSWFTPSWLPDGGSIIASAWDGGDTTFVLLFVNPSTKDWWIGYGALDNDYTNPDVKPIPDFPLVDARFSPFRYDIEWLYGAGITSGCTAELFCVDDLVTRGQMAAFLVRALGLPATANDYFTDDETSIFEGDINKLAASGITTGCNTGLFCPEGKVTRGQMAAFLTRAYKLPATATDYFTDDESSIFEADINKLAASGITSGCTATTYCPTANVTRGQMAAFLNRAEN